MPRLTRISVEHLLGRFDHEINIDSEWEFVILHGPNGVGKTKLLELCQGMISGNYFQILPVPFLKAKLWFDNKYQLSVTRNHQANQLFPDTDPSILPGFFWKLHRGNTLIESWSQASPDLKHFGRYAEIIDDFVPYARLTRTSWRDPETGEPVSIPEILARFPDLALTESFSEALRIPDKLQEFFDSNEVHLIATQRLLALTRPTDWYMNRVRPSRRSPSEREPKSTVVELAADLSSRIGSALAQNSKFSQEQDRTFPERLLGAPDVDISEQEIRDRYQSQADLRSRLAAIGVLEQPAELPLSSKDLEPWHIRVMSIYLEDSKLKLQNFEELLQKVTLLQEVINSRFLYKTIKIDAERGFYFITDRGVEILPAQLSSGEQHEIVLLYRLLFTVGREAIVFIDEPEISLHISWQQEILNDLKRIADISQLQFIVATHSPNIVHEWVDRMVPLEGTGSGPC